MPLRRVCVFAASSPGADPAFAEAARAVGAELAARNIGLVYGGASVGLMGQVADSALAGGGEVIGVLPEALERREIGHRGLTDLRIVGSMHERKAEMAQLSDAFLALPGGLGTFEELFEMSTWTQLGIHHKPVGLLDVARYWEDLERMLDRAVRERFVSAEHRGLLTVERSVPVMLERLDRWRPTSSDKWVQPADRTEHADRSVPADPGERSHGAEAPLSET